MKKKCFYVASAVLLLSVFGSGRAIAEEPGDVAFGNNLSYPVIWSDGVTKALRGTTGMEPATAGPWWYWWGTKDDGTPLSCAPDYDDINFCDDGVAGTANGALPGGPQRAYLQQEEYNVWQAATLHANGPVTVDWIDWGDNLEAVPWYLNSMVRAEVVLISDLSEGALQYDMKHLYGWGKDEMWGLASDLQGGELDKLYSSQATVYSHCARFTIQKLGANCDTDELVWDEDATRWTGDCVVDPPIFNGAVREAEDGPGFYSAEINVKGKVIYGYTWNVKNMNAGPGQYRFTFSLDPENLCPELNTFFSASETAILLPIEEEITTLEESDSVPSGGTAIIGGNFTYIDVQILEKRGGGGKKPTAKVKGKGRGKKKK